MKKLTTSSDAGSHRSVSPFSATCPLKFRGVPGGVPSMFNVRTADHAEAFPAASFARACHQYIPSDSRSGRLHEPVAPFTSDPVLPLDAVARHAPSVQTRNSTLPVPANAGLLNVAWRSVVRTQTPSSGLTSNGTAGAELSIWKLRVTLHADWLPARSRARACQWYVPSGSGAGVACAVSPFDT